MKILFMQNKDDWESNNNTLIVVQRMEVRV
jgi:hypothetical protein